MMFIFSVDFRNEYTALHTSYAVHLSENIANTLHLTSTSCKTIQLAVLLHNIGKISIPSRLTTLKDYDHYLKELYQNSTQDVTMEILSDTVDPQIIKIIDESFLLLEYWSTNKPVPFTPSPATEIVALSYLMSDTLSSDLNVSSRHPGLLTFLKKKYQTCEMDDTILLALEKYYDQIIGKTQEACASVLRTYHHMEDENHYLNTILLHYNNKYHP